VTRAPNHPLAALPAGADTAGLARRAVGVATPSGGTSAALVMAAFWYDQLEMARFFPTWHEACGWLIYLFILYDYLIIAHLHRLLENCFPVRYQLDWKIW
jgi:hypothetical protein